MAFSQQVLLIESGVFTRVLGHGGNGAFFWVSPRAKTLFHIATKAKSVECVTGPPKLQNIMQMERDIIFIPCVKVSGGTDSVICDKDLRSFPGLS